MQQPYHHLVEKQIQNTLSGAQKFDPAVQQLLKLVDQAYRNYDREHQQTENAFKECEKQYQQILSDKQLQNKETEAELIRAKEQAEDGARAKSDFLSVMSHEIRRLMPHTLITNPSYAKLIPFGNSVSTSACLPIWWLRWVR